MTEDVSILDADFAQSVCHYYGTDERMDTITLTNAQGRTVSVEYDWEQGRLAGCTVFSAAGSPLFIRTQTRALRRPALVTAVTNAGAAVRAFSYAYDAVGRPVERGGDSFAYNARGEVTNATIDSAAWSYAYDHIGNRTTASDSAGATAYAANAVNQYTAVGAWTPSYDLDGNLQGDGSLGYTWDAAGRLASARDPNAWRGDPWWSFEYDHSGRRVMKRNWTVLGSWSPPDGYSAFFYDGWNLVHEIRVSGSYQTSHVDYFWGPDLSGTLQDAGGVGGLVAVSINGSFYFPGYDNNGNVVGYWDESGSLVAEYAYDAFGNTISSSGSMASVFPHRFSTKYYDPETDLYYYGYRYYSPNLGRWISRDPLGERGGVSLYRLCKNDPLFTVDGVGLMGVVFLKADEEDRRQDHPTHEAVTSVDDIPEIKAPNMSDNGKFFYSYDGFHVDVLFKNKKICEIQFRLGIRIAESIKNKTSHESGEIVRYKNHVAKNGVLYRNRSENSIYPATLAHEKGHAKAFLEVLKPRIESELAPYFTSLKTYDGEDEELDVRQAIARKVDQLYHLQNHLEKSARYANEGTVGFYDNNPEYKSLGPITIPGEMMDDGVTPYSLPTHYDYQWEKQ